MMASVVWYLAGFFSFPALCFVLFICIEDAENLSDEERADLTTY